MANKPGNSQRYTEAAHQMDKIRFDRPISPTPMELMFDLNRRYRYRIGFFLTPTALYPPQVGRPVAARPVISYLRGSPTAAASLSCTCEREAAFVRCSAAKAIPI